MNITKFLTCIAVVSLMLLPVCSPTRAGSKGSGKGYHAIITNWGEDSVSLIDLRAGTQLADIKVGPKPYDLKVDPTGRFAYVTNSAGSFISVIDIQAMLESDRIPLGGQGPRDIETTKDGKTAIVALSGSNEISVVDLAAKKEMFRVPVGAIPYGVALSDDESLAIITNWGESSVSIVDLKARKEVAHLPVGALPYTVATPPGSLYAYVTNFGANTITAINMKTLKVERTIPVGRSPWGLAVSLDGRKMVACDFFSGEVSFLDTNIDKLASDGTHVASEVARVSVVAAGLSPTGDGRIQVAMNGNVALGVPNGMAMVASRAKNVAIADNGTLAAVSDLANNQIMILDMKTHKLLRRINVGKAPYGVAVLPN